MRPPTGRGWSWWWLWGESARRPWWWWRRAPLSGQTGRHRTLPEWLHTASPAHTESQHSHNSSLKCNHASVQLQRVLFRHGWASSVQYIHNTTCDFSCIWITVHTVHCRYGPVTLTGPRSACRLWVCHWQWSRHSSPDLPPAPALSSPPPQSAAHAPSAESHPAEREREGGGGGGGLLSLCTSSSSSSSRSCIVHRDGISIEVGQCTCVCVYTCTFNWKMRTRSSVAACSTSLLLREVKWEKRRGMEAEEKEVVEEEVGKEGVPFLEGSLGNGVTPSAENCCLFTLACGSGVNAWNGSTKSNQK